MRDAGVLAAGHLPWRGPLADGAALPECGAADHRLAQITVAGPGIDPTTIDSCRYLHAVAAPGDEAALSVSAAGPVEQGSDGPPWLAIAIVVGIVLALIALAVLAPRLRGRRPAGEPPTR